MNSYKHIYDTNSILIQRARKVTTPYSLYMKVSSKMDEIDVLNSFYMIFKFGGDKALDGFKIDETGIIRKNFMEVSLDGTITEDMFMKVLGDKINDLKDVLGI